MPYPQPIESQDESSWQTGNFLPPIIRGLVEADQLIAAL